MSAFFATCPKGLEYLLRDELLALGASEAHEALAGVRFEGTLETAYRACLWSRLASRILLPLAEFDAADDEALYAGVQSIDWSAHLAPHGTLAVDAHTAQSKLTHSQFIAQRAKDAVVDQFRQREGARPGVDTEEPDVRLNLRLKRDRATLSLDLAGTPLHRRFFIDEYTLDYRLHRYPKPLVALMDGIVMGGGMGLAQAAHLRLVTERSRVAMPETGIGLVPDVGASHFLS